MDGTESKSCLGIVAGGGALPIAVAEAAIAQGRTVFIAAFDGAADLAVTRYPHEWVRWGQVGKMLGLLKARGCRDLVIVGGIRRPNLWRARPDLGLLRNLPLIIGIATGGGGDDKVLSGVVRFFEGHGFTVIGAHEIAPGLLAPKGAFGSPRPGDGDWADIALGFKVTRALGTLDVGQAAVVAHGYVLAVEAAEGTDAMLRRCRDLRQWGFSGASGVLVKRPKPGQEMRVDVPAIGPRTVQLAADAGLAGIAVAHGRVLLVDADELIAEAERRNLFIVGVDEDELDVMDQGGSISVEAE
jgi:UDP-2,3-diacylglucosamine hydrolase